MIIFLNTLIFGSVGLLGYALSQTFISEVAAVPAFKAGILNSSSGLSGKVNDASRRLGAIFITVPKPKLLRMYLASFVVLGAAGLMLTRNALGLVVGCAIAAVLPKIAIAQLEAKHKREFTGQLVDALMILSSSLKAGLSLVQAIEELVKEMSGSISREFSLVLRENRMGISLEQALNHLRQRVGAEELDLVVTAIMVARETGGDLTQTFSRLTTTIREKDKLVGRVKSLCTQAKLQGAIMGFLPIGFSIAVYSLNPGYFNIMIREPVGQGLLAYAVASEVIGIYLIRKLSRVDI
ncbi:MAG: type II secretion system F family protein [Candidatus Omnitrophota bacterium]